jgi:hypothetical protein
MAHFLHIPDEPVTLLRQARDRIERCPNVELPRIENGDWIVEGLWDEWQGPLQEQGIERDQFRGIVLSYQNEVRLWIMGERPWSHCVEGLIGRVERRIPSAGTR